MYAYPITILKIIRYGKVNSNNFYRSLFSSIFLFLFSYISNLEILSVDILLMTTTCLEKYVD